MKRSKQWLPAGAVLPGDSTLSMADDVPVSNVVASVSAVNDYEFRGLSPTNRKPFSRVSNMTTPVAGALAPGASDASTAEAHISNRLEIDLHTGYRGSLSGD